MRVEIECKITMFGTPAEQARLESLSAGILAARPLQRPRSVNWESRIEPIEVLGYIALFSVLV